MVDLLWRNWIKILAHYVRAGNLLISHKSNEQPWANHSGHSPKMSEWANRSFFRKTRAICSENRWANFQPCIMSIILINLHVVSLSMQPSEISSPQGINNMFWLVCLGGKGWLVQYLMYCNYRKSTDWCNPTSITKLQGNSYVDSRLQQRRAATKESSNQGEQLQPRRAATNKSSNQEEQQPRRAVTKKSSNQEEQQPRRAATKERMVAVQLWKNH